MPIPPPIRIATRGSALALAQAYAVLDQCRAALPELAFEIKIVKTTGDKLQAASLATPNLPKGLFTKELETALLNHDADLAVHSLKDLPTELPEGLELGAVGKRADARDVLVCRDAAPFDAPSPAPSPHAAHGRAFSAALTLADLPSGAVVATSSTRRSAQLLELRPDLKIVPIRGNVPTRLRKLTEQPELDATILAAAGLARLQFEIQPDGRLVAGARPSSAPESARPPLPAGLRANCLSLEEMLPCVGQAAIGIEIRSKESRLQPICHALNHPETRLCVRAERAFLRAMGGGCQLAVAAYGELSGHELRLRGVSHLHDRVRRADLRGPVTGPEALGEELAERLQR